MQGDTVFCKTAHIGTCMLYADSSMQVRPEASLATMQCLVAEIHNYLQHKQCFSVTIVG